MNIKTNKPNLFNQTVSFNNVWVKFDNEGFSSIDDSNKNLLTDYSEYIQEASADSVDLKEMSIGDLRDLCKAGNYETSEWKGLGKPALIDYLTEKLK